MKLKRGASLALVVVSATAFSVVGIARQTKTPPKGPAVPWIEARAAAAFALGGHDAPAGARAGYRIDGELRLPLGFASMKVASREGVGVATVHARELQSASGEVIRAYEFAAYSLPERAQNIDRLGFFWEAQSDNPSAPWAAYFGCMTFTRASANEQNERPRRYEIIDGLTTNLEAVASLYRAPIGQRQTNPQALYADLRAIMQTRSPRRVDRIANRGPLPSFLGALHSTLRTAAAGQARPPMRQAFIYSAQLNRLELLSIDRDADFGRVLSAGGQVRDPATVHRLRYKTTKESESDGTEFQVWIEIPPVPPTGNWMSALPLAFEFHPRAFLRLRFIRTS